MPGLLTTTHEELEREKGPGPRGPGPVDRQRNDVSEDHEGLEDEEEASSRIGDAGPRVVLS